MDLSFNIKKFRLSKSLSLQQLADRAGLSKASIQQYEDGSTRPSNKALLAISQALEINLWSFFDQAEVKLELAEFRHGEKLSNSLNEKDLIRDIVIKKCQGYVELETLLNANIDFENPISDIKISDNDDVEAVAIKLRKKWKIGNLPIDDLTTFWESKGIKVISVSRDTQSPGVCGFITENSKSIPFIIVNISYEHVREVTRKRFTLAHEAAHLLLNFSNNLTPEIRERLCDRFASAFLLPSTALTEFLGNQRTSISLAELKELKQIFGISVLSIIYRSYEIGLINREIRDIWIDQYKQWRREQKNFGHFKKSDEEPARLKRLVHRALSEQVVSREKIAELLDVRLDLFDTTFGSERFTLI